ncbi:hypothetical protein NKH18_07565 [Streptomyces sp. M10(2022)]
MRQNSQIGRFGTDEGHRFRVACLGAEEPAGQREAAVDQVRRHLLLTTFAAVEAVKILERSQNPRGEHPSASQGLQAGRLIARGQLHSGQVAKLGGEDLTELTRRHQRISGRGRCTYLT